MSCSPDVVTAERDVQPSLDVPPVDGVLRFTVRRNSEAADLGADRGSLPQAEGADGSRRPNRDSDRSGADADPAEPSLKIMPIERVEAELCTLAGQLAAGTCRYLELLAEFDAREGWQGSNIRSCAQWLSWRCGVDLRTAREHLRVARRLADLPRLRQQFSAGRLSYSKARAIARVATTKNEVSLVDAALCAPAAQIERITRGMQRAERDGQADLNRARSRQNQAGQAGSQSTVTTRVRERDLGIRWRWDDDGTLVLWGRLDPIDGARLLAAAVRADAERRRTTSLDDPVDLSDRPESGPDGAAEQTTDRGVQSRPNRAAQDADGSAEPSQCGGSGRDSGRLGGLDPGVRNGSAEPSDHGRACQPDRSDQDCLAEPLSDIYASEPGRVGEDSAAEPSLPDGEAQSRPDRPGQDGSAEPFQSAALTPPNDLGPALTAMAEMVSAMPSAPVHAPRAEVWVHVDTRDAVANPASARSASCRIDDGPALEAADVEQISCAAWIRRAVHAADGRTIDLGRRNRRPSKRLLAVLLDRDRGCVLPGCGRTRFLHAHHVCAWSRGGQTDLDNLVMLCGEHHRGVHNGLFTVSAEGQQRFHFAGADGREILAAPPIEGRASGLRTAGQSVGPATIVPNWDGRRLDLDWAVSCFLQESRRPARPVKVAELAAG